MITGFAVLAPWHMAELLAHNTKAVRSYVHKLIANAYVRVLVHALLIMFDQTELMMKKFNCFSYQLRCGYA